MTWPTALLNRMYNKKKNTNDGFFYRDNIWLVLTNKKIDMSDDDLDRISKFRSIDRGPNFYEDCDKSKKHFNIIYYKYLLENQIN